MMNIEVNSEEIMEIVREKVDYYTDRFVGALIYRDLADEIRKRSASKIEAAIDEFCSSYDFLNLIEEEVKKTVISNVVRRLRG